jgi:hypothetical protein
MEEKAKIISGSELDIDENINKWMAEEQAKGTCKEIKSCSLTVCSLNATFYALIIYS